MSPPRPALVFPTLKTAQLAPEPPAEWAPLLEQAGIVVESDRLKLLRDLVTLLAGANALVNLTAVREPEGIWQTMVLDALALSPLLSSLPRGAHVADVGCGGGFPGLPLAILFPELRFTLIDATTKKIRFVAHAVEQLGLTNVTPVVGRAEKLGAARGGEYREIFDVVMARAVAPLPMLLELTTPLGRPPSVQTAGATLLLVKGERASEELSQAENAIRLLEVELRDTVETHTGKVLVFVKRAATNEHYPRSDGAPKRRPL